MANPKDHPDPEQFLQVVILAAGMGTRLGRPTPKPLTPLADGRSIMARQIDGLRGVFGRDVRISAVVGFKKDLIMESFPRLTFVYNEYYSSTNTAKSLLKALECSAPGGVLWLNGDVVFDPRLFDELRPAIRAGESFVCVNTAMVGAEEIKYTVDERGLIRALSKTVVDGLGEAVGINHIGSADKAALTAQLAVCGQRDYFERGLELAIAEGMRVRPIEISAFDAIEVDFPEDLARANSEACADMTGAAPRTGSSSAAAAFLPGPRMPGYGAQQG